MSTVPTGPTALDVVDAFRQAARQHPDRTAIVHDGTAMDYRTLDTLVTGVAARLGPGPGTVAVAATRTASTVVALLGVLAAGGTYCPIDPQYPAERRDALARAAGCRVVIATGDGPTLLSGVPAIDIRNMRDGWDTSGRDTSPAGQRSDIGEPDEPAYILFTSGSTGAPKPVVTPRRAIAAAVSSLGQFLGLNDGDRVLQFASLNWDTCFEEILPALTTGAALVFDHAAHAGSFARFLDVIDRQRISVVDLPTAYWHEWVRHLIREWRSLSPSLRIVVIGGEAAHPARLADWRALDTADVRLVNTYGCTETTLVTHAVDLYGPLAAADLAGERVPIGGPLPHVVERLGGDGELLIGGDSVALGYQGLPTATAEKFLVLGTPAGPVRFFRTGDLVRRLDGGVLLHEGRADHQLKVAGIRVDPGEAEALISEHPHVAAVAVTGQNLDGLTSLVAYVVGAPGSDAAQLPGDILAFMRPRSPRHLIPARIVVTERLPHTASGKVDRARLPGLADAGS
ncbi:amino acid adenylation domain-containing protein [Streptomyces sp. NPDC023998]|uniref:amino acid adenylation domain-containing protein n=1 Tax=Streptomyces sp. NPDC023998 TaxID=3154597 RepID=UPI0033CFEB79